jgi:hypothetical protein
MVPRGSHDARDEGIGFWGALPGLLFILALDAANALGGAATRAWLLAHAWLWLGLFVGLPAAYLLRWAIDPTTAPSGTLAVLQSALSGGWPTWLRTTGGCLLHWHRCVPGSQPDPC